MSFLNKIDSKYQKFFLISSKIIKWEPEKDCFSFKWNTHHLDPMILFALNEFCMFCDDLSSQQDIK